MDVGKNRVEKLRSAFRLPVDDGPATAFSARLSASVAAPPPPPPPPPRLALSPRRGRSPPLDTDGVWETLADEDGRAEERFRTIIRPEVELAVPPLDAILADVHHELAGRPQPDDLTL